MVKVTGSAKGRDVTFEKGRSITIKDGHLLVDDTHNVIAIFAPDTWRDAVVE